MGRYLAGGIVLVLIVGMICLIVVRRRSGPFGPNRCPWDGSLAEWTTRRVDGLCDYGHSNIRSASHTWRNLCPEGMRPLGGDVEKSLRPPVGDEKEIVRPR